MSIQPGFNDPVFEALAMKAKSMNDKDKNVSLVFDEISIKQGLVYNVGKDTVEDFEDFVDIGQTKYIATHAIAYMVWQLALKWKHLISQTCPFISL